MSISAEPVLVTAPELLHVLDELIRREPIFHRREFGTTRADFEKMVCDDFWEVGASGRRYSKAYVLDTLEKRHSAPHEDVWEARDFFCKRLAQDIYMLTYTLVQDATRTTRRLTIWQHSASDWKIVFHQGTVVEAPTDAV
jgi:hypothetical protein